jgi:hypothetical protein
VTWPAQVNGVWVQVSAAKLPSAPFRSLQVEIEPIVAAQRAVGARRAEAHRRERRQRLVAAAGGLLDEVGHAAAVVVGRPAPRRRSW